MDQDGTEEQKKLFRINKEIASWNTALCVGYTEQSFVVVAIGKRVQNVSLLEMIQYG